VKTEAQQVRRASSQFVLLIINEEAHIGELLRVAKLLLQTDDLQPVIFMEDRLEALGKPKVFVDLGIEILTSKTVAASDGQGLPSGRRRKHRSRAAAMLCNPAVARWIPASIRRRYGLLEPEDIELVRINRVIMMKRADVGDAVLRSRRWASIVICEDNVELDTGIWIAIARKRGIRSIIVPYTISNTAEFAESYVDYVPYQVKTTAQNGLIARLFPPWVLDYKGRRFLRTSRAKIIAVEQLDLTPPNPWLLNSGYADAIAVESQAMFDYYKAAGIPADQMVTTGSLTDDVMASVTARTPELRQRLLDQFDLAKDRPLLLCALPPDQNTYNRAGCQFKDFDDLIGFWGDCLAELKTWNVVVRPHPKTAPARIEALRRKGLAVCYDDTAALVPLCDLYVASVSATIRWAIACGKPVINYDVYQYGYEDYLSVAGVVLVGLRTDFQATLRELTSDASKRDMLTETQRRHSRRWGMLDGNSGRRMVALLRGAADVDQPAINLS
jgi:hypothetical protein